MYQHKRLVWTNDYLDPDDYREEYIDYIRANELDWDTGDEDRLYEFMIDDNDDMLDVERMNLDIQLSQPIIVLGDLGLWHGRVNGYRIIDSGNIKDCLYDNVCDYVTWYVDDLGDLRMDGAHHDGRNYYLYRAFKDGLSETQINNFLDKIYYGKCTRADVTRYTRRLGDEIAKVYGWTFRGRKAA